MTVDITHSVVDVDDAVVGTVSFSLHEAGHENQSTVVFLHGSGPGANAMSNWEYVMGELGGSLRCIAPDVIGFGNSTHPDPPPEGMPAFTELRVRTLVALIEELGLDQITLVGNSMGGIISMLVALDRPELVARMVLMGTAGGRADLLPGLVQMITFYEDPSADSMEALLRLFLHNPGIFGDDLRSIAEARLPNAMRAEVERSHRATFNFEHGAVSFDDDQLASIAMPVLLMHGDDDKIISIDSSRDLEQRLPNARLQVVENAGHWLQIESPDTFIESVSEFVGS